MRIFNYFIHARKQTNNVQSLRAVINLNQPMAKLGTWDINIFQNGKMFLDVFDDFGIAKSVRNKSLYIALYML